MPVFTSSIEVTADYPTIKPSLNLNFARSRALDSRITFTRASVGTYVGRDGLIKTAGNDEPRFDHDPDTLESLGLLIEESRTNLISYSQDFTQSVWQTVNNRATCDNTTGIDDPSGGTTASRWSSGTSIGQELIYRTTGTSTGTLTGQTCTKSIWIRRVSNDGVVSFFLGDNTGVSVNSQLDSVPVGTWVRCSVTRTIVGNNGDTRNYIGVYPGTDGQPTTIDIWGDQFEIGSFPTSYIPTSGSTATRAADNAEIMYNGWYDNSSSVKPSTFVGKFQTYNLGATRIVAEGSNGSTLKDFSMNTLAGSSNFQFVHRYTATDSYDSTEGSGITINTPATFAFSYDGTGGDITGSANGSTPNVGTDDLGGPSIGGDRMRIGSRGNNTLYLNGSISELRYYKFKASSAQLLLLQ